MTCSVVRSAGCVLAVEAFAGGGEAAGVKGGGAGATAEMQYHDMSTQAQDCAAACLNNRAEQGSCSRHSGALEQQVRQVQDTVSIGRGKVMHCLTDRQCH